MSFENMCGYSYFPDEWTLYDLQRRSNSERTNVLRDIKRLSQKFFSNNNHLATLSTSSLLLRLRGRPSQEDLISLDIDSVTTQISQLQTLGDIGALVEMQESFIHILLQESHSQYRNEISHELRNYIKIQTEFADRLRIIYGHDVLIFPPLHYLLLTGNDICIQQTSAVFRPFKEDKNQLGETLLHVAIEAQLAESIKTLLHFGASLQGHSCGRSAIHVACMVGQVDVVEMLLQKGADLNARSEYADWVPLHYAAASGHEEVVKLLLSCDKVEADLSDEDGQTPLSLAVDAGHKEVVKLLLSRGDVNANSRDECGRTPLSLASWRGDKKIVELLLDSSKVEPDLEGSSWGQTPLTCAAEAGQEAVVKMLLNRGDVNANSRDERGRTPLSGASRAGNEAVVKLLLDSGKIEVDSKDDYGETPLSCAAAEGHEAVVKLLLSREDVDVNSRDERGRTPLSWASRAGNEAVVKLLLASGKVELNSKDIFGQTPLSNAIEEGHGAVIELLKAALACPPNQYKPTIPSAQKLPALQESLSPNEDTVADSPVHGAADDLLAFPMAASANSHESAIHAGRNLPALQPSLFPNQSGGANSIVDEGQIPSFRHMVELAESALPRKAQSSFKLRVMTSMRTCVSPISLFLDVTSCVYLQARLPSLTPSLV